MLTPAYANPVTDFYPLANAPPTCLTRHLPPEQETADILLLDWKDVRDILFTVFCNSKGTSS